MSYTERLKPPERDDPERGRIERCIGSLIAEGSCEGNVAMIRLNQLRLAALRFAYDGTLEQHRRLADFDSHRQQGSVSAALVAEAVYGEARPLATLKELFGVAEPSDGEADFFVSNVAADAWAIRHGERVEP